MYHSVLVDNQYLFGNIILEAIPHPNGILGVVLQWASVLCHYLGGSLFFVVALPFLYILYDRRFGIKLVFALLASGLINSLLKFFLMSDRPVGLSTMFSHIQRTVHESSYGFPSGHSQISILLWGMVFLHFKKKLFVKF